jgi:hypothetical protein
MEVAEQARTDQSESTDAVADSSVIAVYQRQVELLTQSWRRCVTDAAVLVATGLIFIVASHASFVLPSMKHVIWLMPLVLYGVIAFTSWRMLDLRMRELEEIHSMVAGEAGLTFPLLPRVAWSTQATVTNALAVTMYMTLWFSGLSI